MLFNKEHSTVFNRPLQVSIGLLFLQQLVVASSTIWIAYLIGLIQEGTLSYVFLTAYLTSLIFPYFPGAFALVVLEKAKAQASICFVNTFTELYYGRIIEWTDSSQRTNKSSILTGEASQAINEYIDYVYHFTSCGLNVALNLFILSFVIEPLFLISSSIGILLAFVVLKLQKSQKKILSLRAQQGRIKWISMLMSAWDNILIGNQYNRNIWGQRLYHREKRLINSKVKLEVFSQEVSVGMAFALLGPSFLLIMLLPTYYGYDFTKLAILVVVLPRLFQVLAYSYEFLFVLSNFPMQESKLHTIFSLFQNFLSDENVIQQLRRRIDWDRIDTSLQGKTLSPSSLLDALPSHGRYTIKGENGSGKSSFLQLLKLINRNNAYYLPHKHELLFKKSKKNSSTGQITRKILEELLNEFQGNAVLLDEWDANLDEKNMKDLSNLIDNLATKKCVIEIRHRS